ncbi:MAG: AAA family ATPase [Planctomycetes bacterium]|nr:AAA family ATPase [Planctomycetota bacterium]
MTAFCDRNAAEVFHSVANPVEIWRADPFDVDAIHSEAREVFRRLLVRAAEAKPPLAGKVLMLHGVAGSGKTHLMRAFRTVAHRDGLAYCGYMQMAAEVGNYARYALQNLIDGLEQRYDPDTTGSDRTGLARLAAGLLDAVPNLAADDRTRFRQEDSADPVRLVEDYADRLLTLQTLSGCDLELIRVLLHLQRPEPRVRNRALMWLRCQDMTPNDRALLGGIVPRLQEEDPQRLLAHLARAATAVHGTPLALLIDQLEDMANQSLPVERFRKLVDVVTALADQVPSVVIVIACLEDYYTKHRDAIGGGKQYRLEKDPEPIRLVTQRTLPEIRDMLARRLDHLYSASGTEVTEGGIAPYTEAHLLPLANLATRQVLDNFRSHHLRCMAAEQWVEPSFGGAHTKVKIDTPPDPQLSQLWNDFHAAFRDPIPDAEDELATALAGAIQSCGHEQREPLHFGAPQPDTKSPNMIEVEMELAGDGIARLLVAVCNKKPQGSGLATQVAEVARRAGEIPVALVRTTPFPVGAKTQIAQQIAKLVKQNGRRVLVENAEWRRMLAFEAFQSQHGMKPGFRAWQRSMKPLGSLRSMREILQLDTLADANLHSEFSASPPPVVPIAVLVPPAPPRPEPVPVTTVVSAAAKSAPPTSPLHLGQTMGAAPRTIELPPTDLTRHAAFIGGSGSGKTTAALALLEQLLFRGVPAVLLDRKGDLARYADPAAWTVPPLDSNRTGDRDRLRTQLDIHLYTPGAAAGRPLGLPVVPPGFGELSEGDREQFARYAAAALGSMLGFKNTDADRQQQAILAQAIQVLAEGPGVTITVPALRELVKEQDDALVARVGGFKAQVYEKLADRLLTLWLGNKQLFATDGEKLDVDALLGTGTHATPGRTRLSVVSTKFLAGADQVDFWVAQFLVAVGRWCARTPSDRLQALFFFDEADLYLPAQRQPATKGPMTDLLKRARSAGVGVMLATQNPGDFDYKCRENVLTWFVGRVTEPRSIEKLRPVLSAAKGDATVKLAGQKAGEFHIATEREVTAVRVAPSLIKTEQLPEDRVLTLAHATGTRS